MLKKAWFLPAVFVLSSVFTLAQTPANQQRTRANDDFAIRGKVVIPSQRGIDEHIEVKLEKSILQVIQTTYTDSSGNFDFRGLTPGSYYISVNLDGFEPVHQLVEMFNSTSVTVFLNKPAVEFRERPTGLDAADPDIVDVTQMKDNFPKKAVQSYEKALDERQKGRFESAVKLLEDAIKIAPTFFHAHNNLGIVYESMKRYPDAEREFRTSHQISAKSDRPLVNLGGLYIEQANLLKAGDPARGKLLDQALDALEEAVKLNPRSALGYFLLGQANYKSDFLEEAEAAFRRAHELDPNLNAVRLMLANVYVRLQKWENVLENLDSYLKENPKAPDRASVEAMRERIVKNLPSAGQ
jgi:Flp pilus assembly protein TadD